MEIKSLPFQFKADDPDARTFDGLLSVFGNVDSYGDIVHPGAFKRTLKNRSEKSKVLLFDNHIYSAATVLGEMLEATETSEGLSAKFKVTDAPEGSSLLTKIREGYVNSLSFGYTPIQFDYSELEGKAVRNLREVRLEEASVAMFPANEKARITGIKNVAPANDFPFDTESPWDGSAAENRCREWASSDGSGDKDTVDFDKYARCFFYVDPDNRDNFDGYKLGYVDIIDGEPRAIWRGIAAVAAVLQGARGGVDIPEDEQDGIRSRLDKYYARADKTPPWKGLIFLSEFVKSTGLDPADPEIELKAGRMLSSANLETLREAMTIISALIDKADPPEKELDPARLPVPDAEKLKAFNTMRSLRLRGGK